MKVALERRIFPLPTASHPLVCILRGRLNTTSFRRSSLVLRSMCSSHAGSVECRIFEEKKTVADEFAYRRAHSKELIFRH